MILVGLTGGIGSGKSTVSSMLADRGAVIIDADAITRELQGPGEPLVAELAERFGDAIIGPDGALDRAALAGVVFADAAALEDLNRIVHPKVGAEVLRRLGEARATGRIVVMDIPLLVENPRTDLSGIVVVDVPVEVQEQRLVRDRGMALEDARARIANQATREQRLAVADRVIDNSGSLDALARQVDEVWEWIQSLPESPENAGARSDGTDAPPT
jgi:dephospho-CoA kinase